MCHDGVMEEQVVRRKPGPLPGTGSKGKRDTITVRVPAGYKQRLAAIARTRGFSDGVSDLLSDLIVSWVAQAELESDSHQQEQLDLKMA